MQHQDMTESRQEAAIFFSFFVKINQKKSDTKRQDLKQHIVTYITCATETRSVCRNWHFRDGILR